MITECATVFFYRRHLPLFSMSTLVRALVRPASATLIMLAFVIVAGQMPIESQVLLLVSKVTIGTLSLRDGHISVVASFRLSGRAGKPGSRTRSFDG